MDVLQQKIKKIKLIIYMEGYKGRKSTLEGLLIRDKSVSVHPENLQILVKEIYKLQHGATSAIMNNISRNRNITYNTRNSSCLETRTIKTVHYGSETIASLGPKIKDLVPQKIKLTSQSNKIIRFR